MFFLSMTFYVRLTSRPRFSRYRRGKFRELREISLYVGCHYSVGSLHINCLAAL